MIIKYILILIIFIILAFLAIILYNRTTNNLFIVKFLNGTWIDKDGNIIHISVNNKNIDLSLGSEINEKEYEFISKQYKYKISKKWMHHRYIIKLDKDMKIFAIPEKKTIKIIKNRDTLGTFTNIGQN